MLLTNGSELVELPLNIYKEEKLMSLRKQGLVLAMEDDSEIEGSADALVDSVTEVEAGADEIAQTEGDVAELNEAVDGAASDAETLEDIHEVMEQSVEKGEGLDETAAEIAEVAIESICNRLGITNARVMPATESFGSANSRLTATKIAMEGIQDTIRKIWEAIKAAAIRIWDKIVQFFTGVTKNVKSLESHLENLKDRVTKLDTGMKQKGADLDNTALAKTFSDNKKADASTAKKIIDNSITLMDHLESIVQTVKVDADGVKSFLEGEPDVAKYREYKAGASESVRKAIAGAQLSLVFTQPGVKGKPKDKVEYFGPLAGTRTIALKNSEREVGTGEGKETIVTWGISISTLDRIEASKIKALSPNEMHDMLTHAVKLVDALGSFEKKQKKFQELKDAVQKVSDVGLANIKKDAEEDSKKSRIVRSISSDINELNSVMSAFAIGAPAAAFAAAKGAADYVSASIANMTSK